jgi:membrane fusion protein (multidrug efflux system)
MANPGSSLMEIVALDTVYFEALVSEIDVGRVRAGQPVQVTIDAMPGRKFTGRVLKILPTADPKSRQFTVRIQVLNKGGELRPGMFARGSIEVDRRPNTVIIPKDAVITHGDGRAVYLVLGSRAKLQPIRTGFETREEVEALSGVSAGDELVVVGQEKLSDGVKVHVAD